MKVAILDDYQDVVSSFDCFNMLADHEIEVFNHACVESELILKLQDTDAIVLIRERTVITESLLAQLPNLKIISQTGKVSNHIDVQLCEQFGVKVLEGVGSPIAPSELCWALIMASSRHLMACSNNLQKNIGRTQVY